MRSGTYTRSGLWLPPVPEFRPRGHRRKLSLMMGLGAVVNPDGTIERQDEEWAFNAVHDAGEQKILQVFLAEQANVSKFLGLLNDASVAETDGTMSAVTEAKTPGSDGYNRQQIAAGDWTDDGLISGDYRFSASEETFGPITGTNLTATHSSLSTTSTGAGVLLSTLALSATTVVAVNQSFKYILRWTAQ